MNEKLAKEITNNLIRMFKRYIKKKTELNSNSDEYLRALREFEERFLSM